MALAVQADINYKIPEILPQDIFRAYDIRGIVGEQLTPEVAFAVGRALGTEAVRLGVTEFVLGQDARPSSPTLADAMSSGLRACGVSVIRIGVVPTPVLYFATHHLSTCSGVMITGSHNPSNYNGIKMVLNGQTLSSAGVSALYDCIVKRDFVEGSGSESQHEITAEYLECIESKIHLARPLKIVVDCGNGMGAITAPNLYRALGCEVIELFCEVDGTFPNHHPDPTVPENMIALQERVLSEQADVGLAFDGDADRLGVVTNEGDIIWPDRQMMLFAQDVLSRCPGGKIVFDVKSTNHLADEIAKAGGEPLMWKTGHSILKAKMIAESAPLAGEMSGHIFFKQGWFGFDDGVYAGARFLDIVAKETRTVSDIFHAFPDNVNTPELKLMIAEDRKHAFVEQLVQEGQFSQAKRITIDGLRLDFGDGWALVRASNTTPCLTLRFEATSEARLKEIQHIVGQEILKLDPTLALPF